MKIETQSIVSGKIEWLEIRGKDGKLKTRLTDLPNLLLNVAIESSLIPVSPGYAYTMASTAESYEDLPGTWSQSGNTITRATGAGTFPTSPSQIGNELYWYDAGMGTGFRCHVTARASDTSITVSGVAKTITGGKLRRFITNGQGVSSTTGSFQRSGSVTKVLEDYDYAAGIGTQTFQYTFTSAPTGYALGSIIVSTIGRIKLPAMIEIDAEDQITFLYTVTETATGRSQTYELGAETVGIPAKFNLTSIVGDGTKVDVTFSAATHFLAGDKLDLRNIICKKFAISSATSSGTTFTINTATAHGLTTGDSVTIENASLAGYNGTFTVSTGSGTVFTILDASNPGTMGAFGTARLTTPGTYFDDLGLATIASMVSSSVARITSAITGPAVELVPIGGDPGVSVRFAPDRSTSGFFLGGYFQNSYCGAKTAANAVALYDITVPAPVTQGWTAGDTLNQTFQAPSYANDYTQIIRYEWNAGTGKNMTRLKQFSIGGQNFSGHVCQITFNTPFDKLATQRLRVEPAKQTRRTLDLTGL